MAFILRQRQLWVVLISNFKIMKKIILPFIVLSMFVLSSCKQAGLADLQNGTWRATLKTESGVEIPFNFELADSAGKKQLDISANFNHVNNFVSKGGKRG